MKFQNKLWIIASHKSLYFARINNKKKIQYFIAFLHNKIEPKVKHYYNICP